MTKITVKRQREFGWGVYVNGKLFEGGFFSKDAAIRLAEKVPSYFSASRCLGATVEVTE